MKKSYILILALLFILGLSACKNSGVDKSKQTKESESVDTSESPDTNESTDASESAEDSETTDTSESTDASENTFKFSALGNAESQEKTGELLKAAGISQERIDEFLGQVKNIMTFTITSQGTL